MKQSTANRIRRGRETSGHVARDFSVTLRRNPKVMSLPETLAVVIEAGSVRLAAKAALLGNPGYRLESIDGVAVLGECQSCGILLLATDECTHPGNGGRPVCFDCSLRPGSRVSSDTARREQEELERGFAQPITVGQGGLVVDEMAAVKLVSGL